MLKPFPFINLSGWNVFNEFCTKISCTSEEIVCCFSQALQTPYLSRLSFSLGHGKRRQICHFIKHFFLGAGLLKLGFFTQPLVVLELTLYTRLALNLKDSPASTSRVLGLKVFATTAGSHSCLSSYLEFGGLP